MSADPLDRIGKRLVLQTAVLAHEHLVAALEVIEQEVGLARLEQGADEGSLPVGIYFGRVEHRNLYGEAAERVHLVVT